MLAGIKGMSQIADFEVSKLTAEQQRGNLGRVNRFKFRPVPLPGDVDGRLYLHSMLGRYEPFESAQKEIATREISTVVCSST